MQNRRGSALGIRTIQLFSTMHKVGLLFSTEEGLQNRSLSKWSHLKRLEFFRPLFLANLPFCFVTPILRLGKEWRTFTYTITST